MTEHTPGPWIINDTRYPIHILAPHRGGEHDPEHICAVGGDFLCPESPDENEANAHLIAAAPELLAALERLAHTAECNILPGPNMLAQARAAIAKAHFWPVKGKT